MTCKFLIIRSNGETRRKTLLESEKPRGLPQFDQIKVKGTVVNQAWPFCHGGSLENTLAVPVSATQYSKPEDNSMKYKLTMYKFRLIQVGQF